MTGQQSNRSARGGSIFRSRVFWCGWLLSLLLMAVYFAHMLHPGWRVSFKSEAAGLILDTPLYLDLVSLTYAGLNLPVVVLADLVGPMLASQFALSRWGAFLLENALAAFLSPVWWLLVAAVVRKIRHRGVSIG